MGKLRSKKEIKAGEEWEKIAAMGQDDEEKAIPAVQEVGEEKKKEDQAYEAKNLELLHSKRKYTESYFKQLRFIIQDIAERVFELPKSWGFRAFYDHKGVGIVLFDPQGKRYIRAFEPVKWAEIDNHACFILCQAAQRFVDKKEAEKDISPGGIILPN